MKKVFVVQSFSKQRDLTESKLERLLVLAYRKGDILYTQNMDSYPNDALKLGYNSQTGEVTLSFKLKETEFLALGDSPDIAKKREIVASESANRQD